MELVLRPRGISDIPDPDGSPASTTINRLNPSVHDSSTKVDKKIRTLTDDHSNRTSLIAPDNPLDHDSRPPLRPPDADGSDTTVIQSNAEPSSPKTSARPTYVQLPSPEAFPIADGDTSLLPLSTGYSHTSSEKSISNLKVFDNSFTRGSPSASFTALNIEPNMPVLVVDDDQLTRTLMKRILMRLGCEVSCAENGEVALEMILGHQIVIGTTPSSDASGYAGPILDQQEDLPTCDDGKHPRYAVVFLDNQMPIMSGIKAVEKLRQLGRKDFIVGVTGMST